MADTPPLRVIRGDWVASPDWLAFPQTVRARSPFDRSKVVELRVARGDLLKAAGLRRRQPAYEFWSMILGTVPPVPGADRFAPEGATGLIALQDAHACFRGVRRPCAEDDDGDQMVAYVLKPTAFFMYEARPPIMFLRREPVPKDLVFVAYAKLDAPCEQAPNIGVLTHWQFVEADETDANLPEDFNGRYTERLW